MKNIVKKLPIPITGLMLGLAALGNLIQSYSNILRNVFGLISGIILLLVLIKIFMFPKGVKEALESPAVASVFPTLSMTIMLLAGYLKPINAQLAFALWIAGIILHILLMIWFTKKFVSNFNIKKVFPSWYIVYVGIAVASVTSGAFEMQLLGKIAFYFALIAYLILLPVVLKRVFIVKGIPEPAQPGIAILSAPASLCLAGYMNSFADKSMILVWFLLIISQVTYFAVLLYMPKLLKLKFYPSYSGFTFPLVISALSLKLTNGFLTKSGNPVPILKSLVTLEELIAVTIVIYVFIRFINFLLAKETPTPIVSKK
ncbi:TDT family transporter [Tissierella sp. Yu-01]|uniref:TDT family transporter n=1 Tax=Tissierella sp. Yu-01 TaxID=3035694 RepID=UPI00240E414D|nr:TDT family transporter [Tissierella sp. Yu-01]WFA08194.1 TDT family transporter [Tissierella sp. Yu-01]